jgi:formylglycine-generating enzyme required for sulfatase activity
MGTPAYMAPEQGMGDEIDHRVDIYSFGVVLYEMITGQTPFEGDTPMSVMMKHIIEPLPKPSRFVPDLPPQVEAVLVRALEKKPEDRYQRMDDFVAALETLTRTSAAAIEAPDDLPEKVPEKSGVDRKKVFWLVPLIMACCLLIGGSIYGVSTISRDLLASETPTALVARMEDTATPEPPPPTDTHPPTLTETAQPPTMTPTQSPTPKMETTVTPETPATPTLGVGSMRISETDGMPLMFVPAGEFLMGSFEDDPLADEDEMPQQLVYLDAFWIDQTEVTNAMFARFIQQSGHVTEAEKRGWSYVYAGDWARVDGADWQHPEGPSSNRVGLDNYPVVHVSWEDAQAYCLWAGRRLPTEAEWEKAARGAEGLIYPWGNQINCNYAQYVTCGGQALPVGSKPAGASPFGALDMAGNVWEWVADWYDDSYYVGFRTQNPQGPNSGDMRVQRGGSWRLNEKYARSANRSAIDPQETWQSDGFRCALSP